MGLYFWVLCECFLLFLLVWSLLVFLFLKKKKTKTHTHKKVLTLHLHNYPGPALQSVQFLTAA